jgi:hypothetical protein
MNMKSFTSTWVVSAPGAAAQSIAIAAAVSGDFNRLKIMSIP